MTFTTRVCAFAVLAIAGLIAWQWSGALDASRVAAGGSADERCGRGGRVAKGELGAELVAAGWPALLVLIAAVMFWDDLERFWKKDDA